MARSLAGVVAVLVWLAAAGWVLANLSEVGLCVVFAVGIGLGAAVDRWWTLIVPVVAALGLVVAVVVTPGSGGALGADGVAVIVVSLMLGAQIPLAAGVAMRRVWVRAARAR